MELLTILIAGILLVSIARLVITGIVLPDVKISNERIEAQWLRWNQTCDDMLALCKEVLRDVRLTNKHLDAQRHVWNQMVEDMLVLCKEEEKND